MGGKDLHVLFEMAIGYNSMDLPDHKEPPFHYPKPTILKLNQIPPL